MTDNHYSMLVLWSEDDQSFLAHVVELPGCVAHGETREEAVKNGLLAIENWIETAEEINRDIPAPLDLTTFEKQTARQAQDVQNGLSWQCKRQSTKRYSRLPPQSRNSFSKFCYFSSKAG
jgi:predicted RNase H-like HicB family nuclease